MTVDLIKEAAEFREKAERAIKDELLKSFNSVPGKVINDFTRAMTTILGEIDTEFLGVSRKKIIEDGDEDRRYFEGNMDINHIEDVQYDYGCSGDLYELHEDSDGYTLFYFDLKEIINGHGHNDW